MRLLFEIDTKDYDPAGPVVSRPSARAILLCEKKIYLVHSTRFDYFKFPGGGIHANESREEALSRETEEETGLIVKRDSIREFGCVHRVQKDDESENGIFLQDSYYYFAEVDSHRASPRLDAYEKEEGFALKLVDPLEAIRINLTHDHGEADPVMIERDTMVLRILIEGHCFE